MQPKFLQVTSKIGFLFICIIIVVNGYSQDIQLLTNFNNDTWGFTTIADKDINDKWNYFGLTEVEALYDATDKLSFESDHYLSYSVSKNFGLSAGLGLQNNNILPQLGLSFGTESSKWSYAIYPTLYFGIADEAWGSSLNSVIEYSAPVSSTWEFFGLGIFDLDYEFDDALDSEESLYLGLQLKEKFQFGVNLDLTQANDFGDSSLGYGIFLGYSL